MGPLWEASRTAPTPASAGAPPNGHFMTALALEPQKTRSLELFCRDGARKEWLRPAPFDSTPVLPPLPLGGHGREAKRQRRSEAQRDGAEEKTGRRRPEAPAGRRRGEAARMRSEAEAGQRRDRGNGVVGQGGGAALLRELGRCGRMDKKR
jgi:hypothetical protein